MLSRVRTRASRSDRAASSSATRLALGCACSACIRSLCRWRRYTATVGKPSRSSRGWRRSPRRSSCRATSSGPSPSCERPRWPTPTWPGCCRSTSTWPGPPRTTACCSTSSSGGRPWPPRPSSRSRRGSSSRSPASRPARAVAMLERAVDLARSGGHREGSAVGDARAGRSPPGLGGHRRARWPAWRRRASSPIRCAPCASTRTSAGCPSRAGRAGRRGPGLRAALGAGADRSPVLGAAAAGLRRAGRRRRHRAGHPGHGRTPVRPGRAQRRSDGAGAVSGLGRPQGSRAGRDPARRPARRAHAGRGDRAAGRRLPGQRQRGRG